MARKRYTPEQIIGMLREAEVRLSQGEKVGEISRSPFRAARSKPFRYAGQIRGCCLRRGDYRSFERFVTMAPAALSCTLTIAARPLTTQLRTFAIRLTPVMLTFPMFLPTFSKVRQNCGLAKPHMSTVTTYMATVTNLLIRQL